MGPRSRLWIVVVLVAMAGLISPMQEKISAQSAPAGVMISEFRFSAPTLQSDEYIELFNSSFASIDVGGWVLKGAENRSTLPADRATIPANTILGPGCYYLIASSTYTLNSIAVPDLRYTSGVATNIPDDGGIAIFKADRTTIADQVGFQRPGTALTPFFETERLLQTVTPQPGRIYERKPNTFTGFQDTNNNVNDFVIKGAAGPQNKTGPCLQFTTYTPHDIQGAGAISPLSGSVRVRGVVTAKKSDGFFVQTEPGFEDTDPNTSEGLFVSANGASLSVAVVGHLVRVIGGIEEFVSSRNSSDPSFTRIANVVLVEDLGARSVPTAYSLTNAELSPAGSLAQLERFEGMRVTAPSLTAVSGTDDDGAFFAVLTGQLRPFREPGVHAGYPVLPCALPPCRVPVFDGNPERLRVDSDGLDLRARVFVSTGALITDVTGPLEFSAGNYTLLPESLSVAGGMSIVPAEGADANAFTVATLNLGAQAARLAKASQAVRNVLNAPDVIAVQGVDAPGALTDLAAQINSDAGATLYDAYPGDNADDTRGVGFLLKAGRASALGQLEIISPRASLALRVRVQRPSTSLRQDVTVVVNQLQSLTDIELNDATGAAVRTRRRTQAEALANYLQNRQSSNPSEAIIALGDFNAFDFNDGYVDVVGIARGVAAPPDRVALASPVVVAPPFFNADALNAPAERYTSLSNGNAQSLDHVLVSASLGSQIVRLAHVRLNADFPLMWHDVDTTPVRFSDRDPLVAYVAFPADVEAPVIDAVQDVVVEATSANGALVTFATPAAHDNIDPVVTVNCVPASGSVFAVGNTGVTCSATDVAGNSSSVSFTVTVQDTVPPELSTSGDQVVEATSSSGAIVNFTATATDVVTGDLNVFCSPLSSGSEFPIGTTRVICSTHDASGNSVSASFSVLVQDTTSPVVSVPDDQVAEAASADGAVVTFAAATATDAVTSPLTVVCSPASGSTFALGTTLVSCTTDDAANNHASASFHVTVRDTTAPVVSVPSNQVAEATSAAGAIVTFGASASDAVTSSLTVSCSPANGSRFPLGNTLVTCATEDAAHNPASAFFIVTVRDTTAPALSVPAEQVAEATSAAGAVVTFNASATDAVTSPLTVVCSPASGATFALGTTLVTCTSEDAAHNPASASFNVTVHDTTAPALVLPSNITAEATSSAGRQVSFTVTASDAVTASPTVACAPAPGSTFPVGTTAVACSAIDAEGNTATGSFNVTITPTSTPPPSVGHMAGVGSVLNAWQRTWFSFDVRESQNGERGWVWLMIRDGWGRPDRLYAASVYDVQFSNSEGYEPGRFPRSGIDTVTFKGFGWWNGRPGYRFEITASDRGEPGRGRDTFTLTVFGPNGAVVETASGSLRDGNIQSLR